RPLSPRQVGDGDKRLDDIRPAIVDRVRDGWPFTLKCREECGHFCRPPRDEFPLNRLRFLRETAAAQAPSLFSFSLFSFSLGALPKDDRQAAVGECTRDVADACESLWPEDVIELRGIALTDTTGNSCSTLVPLVEHVDHLLRAVGQLPLEVQVNLVKEEGRVFCVELMEHGGAGRPATAIRTRDERLE